MVDEAYDAYWDEFMNQLYLLEETVHSRTSWIDILKQVNMPVSAVQYKVLPKASSRRAQQSLYHFLQAGMVASAGTTI